LPPILTTRFRRMAGERKSYLDACCFIDMVRTKIGKILTKDRETDVWFLKRLLEANRDGEVEIYTSTLTIAECSHGGDGDISPTVKSELNRLLMSGQYVRLVQMTPFIAVDARDLRWNHGIALKGADSIHGHLEKYSLEAGRSAIEVAVVSVSGLMGAGLSSRLFEAATRAIGKTI
jgi:hypothetical protein